MLYNSKKRSELLDVLMMFFVCLLQTVNQLAMETNHVMKGSHSRKTAAFVRVSFLLTPKHDVNNSMCIKKMVWVKGLRIVFHLILFTWLL